MNNASANLDADLLADGVILALLHEAMDEADRFIRKAEAMVGPLNARILAATAHTPAGVALQIEWADDEDDCPLAA